MIDLEDELAADYLAECQESLISIESDLLALNHAPEPDLEAANRAFRALHWVQGGAGVFDLTTVGSLARHMEDVLGLIRSRKLAPSRENIGVLLDACDGLRDLIGNAAASNQADIAPTLSALTALGEGASAGAGPQRDRAHPSAPKLRMLLVEDDFASRLLLHTFLAKYGECHIAVNGREAVEAFRSALEHGERYDLVCMDIMMPEMDGREAVRQIRALEEEFGILSTAGAKIVMTTALDGVKDVIACFRELCDSYLTKPIELAELLAYMRACQLIE